MLRYFYAWTPLVTVTTVVFLTLPWLGLIALAIISLGALAGLAFVFVFVPYVVVRTIGRRWQGRSGAQPQTAPALSPAMHRVRSAPAAALATSRFERGRRS